MKLTIWYVAFLLSLFFARQKRHLGEYYVTFSGTHLFSIGAHAIILDFEHITKAIIDKDNIDAKHKSQIDIVLKNLSIDEYVTALVKNVLAWVFFPDVYSPQLNIRRILNRSDAYVTLIKSD